MLPETGRSSARHGTFLAISAVFLAMTATACAGGGEAAPCSGIDLSSDLANCGTCGNACSFPNAIAACVAGACQPAGCQAGFADLDGGANGCEYACPVYPPVAESCNEVDDDCDGLVDEDFDLAGDPLHCGSCGTPCDPPHAIALCVAGECRIVACQAGFADLDGGTHGCEYACPVSPPGPESCNGLDDDCDGLVDESLTPPANFCNQLGPCAGAVPTCAGSRGWVCNYPQLDPRIEVKEDGSLAMVETRCDGFDGNCNGLVDESFPDRGTSCILGTGRCAGSGHRICAPDGLSTVCDALPDALMAVDELCNGIDDDCDGQVDEVAPVAGATCYNGGAHPCQGWRDPMVKVGATWIYRYEASRPGATSGSAGTLGTRACSTAGVLPWAPITEPQAAAACAAVIDSSGTPMRLCSADEWTTACNVGVTSGSVWSYAINPTVYSAGTCNGLDAGVGAAWATGSGASCYANQAGGRVYDLSGNVAEWTLTTVVVSPTTYFKVRGGAFDTTSAGTSCNFDFTLYPPGYLAPSLGFRCCADNEP